MQPPTVVPAKVRKQSGSSLLEVLIAVLVLGIGMLGMAALQAVTLKNSNSSAARSQAVMQSYSMLDQLRLNRELAMKGGFNVSAWTCTTAVAADSDDSTDYSAFNGWLANVHDVLGADACGRIQCGANQCTVGVRWDDSRATVEAGDSDAEPLEIETTTGL